MASFIKKFDKNPKHISFSFLKEEEHQTVFGGVLGIIGICISIAVFFYFVSEMWLRKKPNVITESHFLQNSPLINITNLDFYLSFPDPDDRAKSYDARGLISTRAEMIVHHDDQPSERLPIETIPCSEYTFASEKNKQLAIEARQDLEKLLCIKKDNASILYLNSDYGKDGFSQIYFKFKICTTENCKVPFEENPYKALDRFYLSFDYFDNLQRLKNYTYFEEPVLKNEFWQLAYGDYASAIFNMKQVIYINDIGFLFETQTNKTSFGFLSTFTLSTTSRDDEYLGSLAIQSHNDVLIVYRIYQKIQDVLANVGGIESFIVMAIHLVSYFYTEIDLKEAVVNQFGKNENILKHHKTSLNKFNTRKCTIQIPQQNLDNSENQKIASHRPNDSPTKVMKNENEAKEKDTNSNPNSSPERKKTAVIEVKKTNEKDNKEGKEDGGESLDKKNTINEDTIPDIKYSNNKEGIARCFSALQPIINISNLTKEPPEPENEPLGFFRKLFGCYASKNSRLEEIIEQYDESFIERIGIEHFLAINREHQIIKDVLLDMRSSFIS